MTKILIADDINENRYLLVAMFNGNGYEVVAAENGAEALELALRSPPDLIVTDILMPVMDGFELCRRWKTDDRLKAVPFLFYTATYTGPNDERLALSLGADRFVVKPQKPEALMQVVRELLDAGGGPRPAASPTPLIGEKEALLQHREALFRKLQRKVEQLQAEIAQRQQAEEAHRQLEAQLRVAQRMEAIGSLAGGIAHDFNNILSVILSYTDFALKGLHPGDPLRADLAEVKKAGDRAAALTRQLLAFSRKQLLRPEPIDLGAVAANLEKMLNRLIGEDIELELVPGRDLAPTLADPSQIEQVIMNLVVNARDAMPDGGKLTIETANVQMDEERAARFMDMKPGRYVLLSVSDTGCGMDEPTRLRIFEPFFTTKEMGRGTGLGLSTVYGIIKQSGGYIDVDSEPGKGTTFRIYLPRSSAVATRSSRVVPSVASARGTETVLIVEDEEAVRNAARRVLAAAGYTVLTAANGGEALLICETHPSKIHLVVTDVVMPQMSGIVFAERLAKIQPDIKVLCTTGYTDDMLEQRGLLDRPMDLLPKPYDAASLMRKVREVLDARP